MRDIFRASVPHWSEDTDMLDLAVYALFHANDEQPAVTTGLFDGEKEDIKRIFQLNTITILKNNKTYQTFITYTRNWTDAVAYFKKNLGPYFDFFKDALMKYKINGYTIQERKNLTNPTFGHPPRHGTNPENIWQKAYEVSMKETRNGNPNVLIAECLIKSEAAESEEAQSEEARSEEAGFERFLRSTVRSQLQNIETQSTVIKKFQQEVTGLMESYTTLQKALQLSTNQGSTGSERPANILQQMNDAQQARIKAADKEKVAASHWVLPQKGILEQHEVRGDNDALHN